MLSVAVLSPVWRRFHQQEWAIRKFSTEFHIIFNALAMVMAV
jgi:hypothetical protein